MDVWEAAPFLKYVHLNCLRELLTLSLLCFWVVLVSFSKHPPATWVVNAQPCSLEMPLSALPAAATA